MKIVEWFKTKKQLIKDNEELRKELVTHDEVSMKILSEVQEDNINLAREVNKYKRDLIQAAENMTAKVDD